MFLTVLYLLHYYQWDICKKKYILIFSTESVWFSGFENKKNFVNMFLSCQCFKKNKINLVN